MNCLFLNWYAFRNGFLLILSISLDTFSTQNSKQVRKQLSEMEQISIPLRSMDICSISGAAWSGGWNERFIVPFSFNSRRKSSVGRAYPAIVPIAHIIPPDHCFQLGYCVIFRFSVPTVKQLFLHSCPHTFATGVIVTYSSGTVHALNQSDVF